MFYRFIWEMFYLDTVVLSAKVGLHESRDKKKKTKQKKMYISMSGFGFGFCF